MSEYTRRGTIKVMVNKQGIPRIQHECDGDIKVYTQEQWEAKLAKEREDFNKSLEKAEAKKAEPKAELPEKPKSPSKTKAKTKTKSKK